MIQSSNTEANLSRLDDMITRTNQRNRRNNNLTVRTILHCTHGSKTKCLSVLKSRATPLHSQGYRSIFNYSTNLLKYPNGSDKFVLVRNRVTQDDALMRPKGIVALPASQVFDGIYSAQRCAGHSGVVATWLLCQKAFYNITQHAVSVFNKYCSVCTIKSLKTIAVQGTDTPIFSGRFLDRILVDLIDFGKFARENQYGVLMKWVMVVKDHFIGLCYIEALPRNTPLFVGLALDKIFSFMGYPKILHTDNGKEFTGKSFSAS
jgi:hypothetical protein